MNSRPKNKSSIQTPTAVRFLASLSSLLDLSIDFPWLFVFLTPQLPMENDKQIEILCLALIRLFQLCKRKKVNFKTLEMWKLFVTNKQRTFFIQKLMQTCNLINLKDKNNPRENVDTLIFCLNKVCRFHYKWSQGIFEQAIILMGFVSRAAMRCC